MKKYRILYFVKIFRKTEKPQPKVGSPNIQARFGFGGNWHWHCIGIPYYTLYITPSRKPSHGKGVPFITTNHLTVQPSSRTLPLQLVHFVASLSCTPQDLHICIYLEQDGKPLQLYGVTA